MSGMDRLTDEALDAVARGIWTFEEIDNAAMARELLAHRRASQAAPAPFQARVDPWMQACFGAEVSADKLERGDRLLEEVLELLQSGDYPSERVAMLTSYVWSRDIGEPEQEVGGVMVTLAAYCLAHGLDMHGAGETELARIWTKVDKIRAKQAAKPKGSALPQVWAAPAPSDGLREENERLIQQVENLSTSVGEWRSLAMSYVSKDPLYSSRAALTPAPAQEVKP